MVNALERLTEEVKCVRVQGRGKIYIQQKGLNLILGIPGPDNSVWSGGLFSIIIRCSESKSFHNNVNVYKYICCHYVIHLLLLRNL